jgi:pilus assembly protein CpaB
MVLIASHYPIKRKDYFMKRVYVIAGIFAVAAGILLYLYMGNLEEKYRGNYDQVLIAVVTIPENTRITNDMVKLGEVPREAIHRGAATNLESVIGGITSQKIYEGEQVLKSKIKKGDGSSGKVSYSIPENMRAITIGVDTVTGVSGFIRAMDRVDIIAITLNEEEGKPRETATLILENVEVLAVGLDPNSISQDYNPAEPVSVITLLTTPKDAVKLSLAGTAGKICAVLRSPADQKIENVPPVNERDLI